MELALIINHEDDINILTNAFDLADELNASIKLKVQDLESFTEHLEKNAELFSRRNYLINSLYVFDEETEANSFEDIVMISSQLEDLFDIELSIITTHDEKFLLELSDFYSTLCEVNSYYGDFQLNPIEKALNLERNNLVQQATNLGLCYQVNLVPESLFDIYVNTAIAEYVNEIYFEFCTNFDIFNFVYILDLISREPDIVLTLKFPSYYYVDKVDLVKSSINDILQNFW